MSAPNDKTVMVELSINELRYLKTVMFLYHGHASKMNVGQARLANKLAATLENVKKGKR